MVGSLASQSTAWRDIKVYQHFNTETARWDSYAYVTADSASVGTMIIDLRSLPDEISVVSTDETDISAHNVYLSNVDYCLGVALNDVEPICTSQAQVVRVAPSTPMGFRILSDLRLSILIHPLLVLITRTM